jgi:hypothetical protein
LGLETGRLMKVLVPLHQDTFSEEDIEDVERPLPGRTLSLCVAIGPVPETIDQRRE